MKTEDLHALVRFELEPIEAKRGDDVAAGLILLAAVRKNHSIIVDDLPPIVLPFSEAVQLVTELIDHGGAAWGPLFARRVNDAIAATMPPGQ